MLMQGGEVMNVEEDPNAIGYNNVKGSFVKPGGHHGHGNFQDYRGHNLHNLEGRALFALNKFGENAKMVSDPTWLNRLQHHHALAVGVEPPGTS